MKRSSVIKPSEDQDIVDIKMSFIIVICLLRITGRWGFQMFSRGDHLTTEPIVQSADNNLRSISVEFKVTVNVIDIQLIYFMKVDK